MNSAGEDFLWLVLAGREQPDCGSSLLPGQEQGLLILGRSCSSSQGTGRVVFLKNWNSLRDKAPIWREEPALQGCVCVEGVYGPLLNFGQWI